MTVSISTARTLETGNEIMTRSFRDYDPQSVLWALRLFSVYDPEQGGFVRTAKRRGPQQSQTIGELVGYPKEGYLMVRLLGFQFYVSHLVWLAEHGSWPQGDELDHIDQVPTNNHISNLRDVTCGINSKNRRMCSTNTTGYTGVTFDKCAGKYRAQVEVESKFYSGGRHNTPEEAYAARRALIDAHPEWGFTTQHGKNS